MKNNMKKAREDAGYSQKEVAITLNVAAPTVSDWESGKKNPNNNNLRELVRLYNVSADYLLGLTDKTEYPPEVSQKICAEIQRLYKDDPSIFDGFMIPGEVEYKILAGTYSFDNITFPQFANRLKKPLSDFFSLPEEDQEVWELRDALHKRPELKVLFDATKTVGKDDIERAVKIIEALKPPQED